MAGPRAGPIDIEAIIGEERDNLRQPADLCNFPILRCPHRNGGIGKGYIRQMKEAARLQPVRSP